MEIRITKKDGREVVVCAPKWNIQYGEMATLAEELHLSFSCYTLENGDTVFRFSNGFENSPEENNQALERLKEKLEKLFV